MLIIRRIAAFFLACLLMGRECACADGFPGPLSAQSAVLMWNGEIIYEKNAHQKLPMASTTKLMTALLTAERCDMEAIVEIKESDCEAEGSSMCLRPGETLTVRALLEGLLLVSGNDAALALARYVGGSVKAFVELMNLKAAELSMNSTHFNNPHGLSEEGHFSTAEDMGLLMLACLENRDVGEIMAMKSAAANGRTLVNHNKLLYTCKGCSGGKTGFTEAAGRCLVSSCMREGAELVCVTLNDPDDWNDHISLYDRAFREYSLRDVAEGMRFSVPLIGAEDDLAYAVPQQEKKIFTKRRSQVTVAAKLPWFLFAPVRKGDAAGKAVIMVDGKRIGEYPLVCRENIAAEKP